MVLWDFTAEELHAHVDVECTVKDLFNTKKHVDMNITYKSHRKYPANEGIGYIRKQQVKYKYTLQ